jgi:nucleotide-binding universal stress UspA family protein
MFRPRLILHPTDFSASSHYAYQVATDLAAQHQATVLVLHVVETLGPENVTYRQAVSELQPEGYRTRLLQDLRQQAPALRPAVPVRHLLAEGDPVAEIERAARDNHCDLIVMGTHGHTGLRRLFLSSTADQVHRVAPCPVLTAKLPDPDNQGEPA